MDNSGLTGLSRLDLMKAAAIELLEQYDNAGNVSVRIITFADSGTEHGATWESVASARNFILGLSADNGTNYDAAVAAATNAFANSGKLATAGVRNVSYFLSDGDPDPDSTGLDSTEEAAWTTFLNTNDIQSIAVGIGSGIPNTNQLNPIAYDGRGAGTNTNGSIVIDPSQLEASLVTSALTTSGNLGATAATALAPMAATSNRLRSRDLVHLHGVDGYAGDCRHQSRHVRHRHQQADDRAQFRRLVRDRSGQRRVYLHTAKLVLNSLTESFGYSLIDQ